MKKSSYFCKNNMKIKNYSFKNMRRIFVYITLFAAILLLDSCNSAKDVAYFQNIDQVSLAASKGLYDARIMPKDELTITVNASEPTAAAPFNLAVTQTTGTNDQLRMSSQQMMVPYLVDNNGDINYPKIGKIHVQGMTKNELQDCIADKIQPFFKEDERPIVTVRMSNYRVTVMGEVASPRVVSVSSEKMSVLEAIASAGDLSIYGQRTNVLVIREDETGQKTTHRLDLTDANVINDPYYYVHQNDVIYVTPNDTKAKNSDIGQSTSLIISATSILLSVANLIINILN